MSRILLIHAFQAAQQPAWDAFARVWPKARIFNLLDDSLSADLAAEGGLTNAIADRLVGMAHYAAASAAAGHATEGVLFTCSAFGPAMRRAQAELHIPALRPNEAAFEAALDAGPRIGILVSFEGSLPPLAAELREMARERGREIEITPIVAEGALSALRAGRMKEHDERIAAAAAGAEDVDALVLGQFSIAAAAALIPDTPGRRVFTTPDTAVAKLRRIIMGRTSEKFAAHRSP